MQITCNKNWEIKRITEFDKSFSLIISMRQKNVYGYRSFPSILLVLSDAKLSTFYTFLCVFFLEITLDELNRKIIRTWTKAEEQRCFKAL